MKETARMVPCTPDPWASGPYTSDQAPLSWPRVAGSLLGFALLAAGFMALYSTPAPAEWGTFCFLLMLIFLETLEAGWYRPRQHRSLQQERKPVAREARRAQLLRKVKGR